MVVGVCDLDVSVDVSASSTDGVHTLVRSPVVVF